MNMTLSTKIAIVYLIALLLACLGVCAGFQWALGPALSDEALWQALGAGLGVTALLGLLGALFIYSRLAPIRQCVLFAEAITQGHEDATLEVYRSDCLGHLAESLRIMVAKLEGQAHWYESILNTLPLSVSVTDNDMAWTFCNTYALKSMDKASQEDVVGRHCSEKGGNICNTPQCGIEQLRRGVKKVINHMPNGKTMQIMLDYLHDAHGNQVGHVEIGEDITARIALEKRAMEAAHQGRMSTVTRLEGVIATLQQAAEGLNAALDDVRKKADVAAGRMSETATAMNEMNSTVLEVAHNAEGAAEAATSVQGHAHDGAGLVTRTIRSMQDVQRQSTGLKGEMSSLDQQAKDIGAVLTLIRDIADQTNLLALNAAIEAARAGDAGRGFAVVADEVRKLAEKTMSATRDVETAIAAIQEGTGNSAATVDSTVAAIEEVSHMAEESGQALARIADLAGDSSSRVSAIAAAATEQSAASDEINRHISEVNTLSAHIVEAMDQAAGQVSHMAEQVDVVSTILDDIRKEDADNTGREE
ncbi:methyl-accepting chemotaxis protein [Desulfovibrio legallii]|uniref:Methyl-accepting chemotaxis protein n=1 Tax=Desulfovibrio legallii TaxID=571438 RepID=A0A1G7HVJ4_9BACT|nr:methyl-accepting chemotaxis protein [Desulfovibrio legallii]SDF04358.1 methyl-accepting chemotaxis protein [Desulfovibrio legallii]